MLAPKSGETLCVVDTTDVGRVYCLRVLGSMVLTGHPSGEVAAWDLASGQLRRRMVADIARSPGERRRRRRRSGSSGGRGFGRLLRRWAEWSVCECECGAECSQDIGAACGRWP